MNDKIKELIEQCEVTSTSYFDGRGNVTTTILDREKFAVMLIKECAKVAYNVWEEGTQEESARESILKHFGII